MAAFNFQFKLCWLYDIFVMLRDNNIYIGKNAIGEMGKMGFEQGFIGILSNACFGNGEKLLIVPGKYQGFCVVNDVWMLWEIWIAERYRLIGRIYWD